MTLLQGQSGTDVGAMQQALVEAGYAVPPDDLAAQLYGRGTFAALRAFQAAHVGPDGKALAEDGIVGPATSWALAHPGAGGKRYTADGWRYDTNSFPSQMARVLAWAIGMIGIFEQPDGSNRSAEIDQWTGMVGAPPEQQGPPWCAYFVSAALQYTDGGSPFGTLASAYKILDWAKRNGRALSDAAAVAPIAGDLFVIMRGDFHGHTGIIVSQLPDGRVCTVEGNAGNAVRGLVRGRDQFTAIIRPVTLG